MDRSAAPYWESLSGAFRFRPPLTPSTQDLDWYGRGLREGKPEAARLLLGVTPGIAGMRRPPRVPLYSIDWSEGMLRRVLPPGSGAPVRADWRELPLAGRSCGVAFCDLFFPALPSLEDGKTVLAELARVLRPGGGVRFRCFVRTEPGERVPALIDELRHSAEEDFALFRMRFAAAVQGPRGSGVALDEVWRSWRAHVQDARALGPGHWAAGELAAMERWKGSPVRYAFPTLAELRDAAAPRFDFTGCELPAYARERHAESAPTAGVNDGVRFASSSTKRPSWRT